jgi:hypothetical protein
MRTAIKAPSFDRNQANKTNNEDDREEKELEIVVTQIKLEEVGGIFKKSIIAYLTECVLPVFYRVWEFLSHMGGRQFLFTSFP